MSDVIDAPDQQVLVDQDVLVGDRGQHALVRQIYQPPLDGRSDDYAAFDMQIAKGIGELLNKHYFAYPWKSYADSQQGVVGFSIPELMGPTLHYVINLKQFSDLTPELIVRHAGELLERMHLPRGQIDMAQYLWAKQNRDKFHFGDKKIQ